jgi:hypothetical protein
MHPHRYDYRTRRALRFHYTRVRCFNLHPLKVVYAARTTTQTGVDECLLTDPGASSNAEWPVGRLCSLRNRCTGKQDKTAGKKAGMPNVHIPPSKSARMSTYDLTRKRVAMQFTSFGTV